MTFTTRDDDRLAGFHDFINHSPEPGFYSADT
jgi:hypothetical protein